MPTLTIFHLTAPLVLTICTIGIAAGTGLLCRARQYEIEYRADWLRLRVSREGRGLTVWLEE